MSSADLSRLSIPNTVKQAQGPSSGRMRGFVVCSLSFIGGLVLGFAIAYSTLFKTYLEVQTFDTSRTSPTSSVPPAGNEQPSTRQERGILQGTGYVVASRRAAVSSKATGRLAELRVREGDKVKMGDVLGVLENEDVKAQVREREAALAAAISQERAVQADLTNAQSLQERYVKLSSTGALALADQDQVKARALRAKADLISARANIELARAQLERTKVDLDYTFIRAPFDGTVLTKSADVGEVVAPFGSSTSARASIVTLADMSSLEIEADINESQLSRVSVGQTVEIMLDSFPKHPYAGIVKNIVPTVDRAKATVQVKVGFVSLDEVVIPGMSAKVSFGEPSGGEPSGGDPSGGDPSGGVGGTQGHSNSSNK